MSVTILTHIPPAGDSALALDLVFEEARTYIERSLFESTRRTYARELAAIEARCHARALTALPAQPQTLAAHLELAGTDRPATIGRNPPRFISWAEEGRVRRLGSLS